MLSFFNTNRGNEQMRISQDLPTTISVHQITPIDNTQSAPEEKQAVKNSSAQQRVSKFSTIMQNRRSERLAKVKDKLIKDFNLSEPNAEKLGIEILKLQGGLRLGGTMDETKKREICNNIFIMARPMLKDSQLSDFLAYLKKRANKLPSRDNRRDFTPSNKFHKR